ncbi:DUF1178 family protein [Sphingomonas sp.]|jgi:hypothetical protein|uniref:DUF1178 family protein n=1 Tax=Sphingomonas sp. TaxID=28214 RepID=UPI002629CCAB|nr:DUF1178 family protein [Sphingomonas sp.]MDF2495189.1 hypothetical protein [Sphingomonas sp.]
MIVFDLRCGAGHVFEAWFSSSGVYEDQRWRKLVACPMCGDTGVDKAVMAPNVSPKGNSRPPAASPPAPMPDAVKSALKVLAEAQRKALQGSRWVGDRFATEARAMHSGDQPDQPIHGQATLAEAKALVEEGVPIAPLPLPVVPPEKAN